MDSADRNRLVIGGALQGAAKAYSIQIIGYHHQVRDTVGGEPVLVTSCTVCRTGRVYGPLVEGRRGRSRAAWRKGTPAPGNSSPG